MVEITVNEWRATGSSRPNFRRAQSKVKQMMIFAYDHQGVITADRVSCGRSVTRVCYCAFMQKLRTTVHKNRLQLLVAGPLILHDNARPHTADVITKKFRDCGWKWGAKGYWDFRISDLVKNPDGTDI